MKTIMRNGNTIRRGVSLLLMMSLLIALLPSASIAATGAYGDCTVTAKNVVIRSTPAGSRTGYFAQKGTYPMIGPVEYVGATPWYNIRTSSTSGYVSGDYATASYGSAGMPSTDKIYTYIQANVLAYPGTATAADHEDPAKEVKIYAKDDPNFVEGSDFPVLQLVTGSPYSVSGVDYIDIYYNNIVHHTRYNNNIANGVMTQDNLNDYITGTTWKQAITVGRSEGAKGDYLTHAMQAALTVLNYYDDDVDGSYGPKTTAAVKDFKEDMIADGYAWTANGVAGSAIFAPLFEQATAMIEYIRSNPGLGGYDDGTSSTTMIQTTVDNLRIRKSYTTSSTYVGMIPTTGTILTYTRTHLSGSVTWYYIQYDGTYGWVMGTYVTEYTVTTGSSSTTPTITNWGTVTITKKLVAIRVTANGSRTGYHVNTGDVCTLTGPGVEAGGYTWYPIRTENGRTGYVRGDCCKISYGSAGMPECDEDYVNILFDTEVFSGSAGDAGSVSRGTIDIDDPAFTSVLVLQLVTGDYYSHNGTNYIDVYYKNEHCHVVYTAGIEAGLMTSDNVNTYITDVVWKSPATFYNPYIGRGSATYINTGDIRVHAVQAALYILDYYDDDMDGMFGDNTGDAVVDFKGDYMPTATQNELIGPVSADELFEAAVTELANLRAASAATDTGDGTVLSAGDFGTVNTVKRGSWSEIDGGATSKFAKGSIAYVMYARDKNKVFRIYRWSGANHADCVTYDTSDTATLCSILGFAYRSSHPTSSQLSKIKSYGNDDYPKYTWPDFRGGFYGASISGSLEKIPVYVNLNGTVYCASIYVIPHGFNGTSGFSLSKLSGQYYYERNNMYGMMCVHFYGSTTHASGTVNATHMNNINYAYNHAASIFGSGKVQ